MQTTYRVETTFTVPRKARSRRSRSPLAPILVLVFAIFAGWWLLRPRSHAQQAPVHHTPVALLASPSPSVEASATPRRAALPTTTPTTPEPVSHPSGTITANPPTSRAKLAIIIDDCGQWLAVERGFIALGVPVTLSVLPDVHGTKTIADEAQAAGKGVMLHLPMETLSGLNPGPGEVTTEMSDKKIDAVVSADLAQIPFAQGVNNHEGSKATANARVMHDVAHVLEERHLFFVDSRTNAKSVAAETTKALGIPTASRDVFLDNQANEAYTIGQLREAGRIALAHGSAIAIGHPRATTLAALQAMLPEFAHAGITLVLVRDLTENP